MSSDEKTKIAKLPWACVGLAFLTLVAGIYWMVVVEYDKGVDSAGRAELGDFWGGHLGAVTAFAASLLFLAGLLFQSRELSLQREELRLTRNEMKENTVLQKEQAAVMERSAKISSLSQIYNHFSLVVSSKKEYLMDSAARGKMDWSKFSLHILIESHAGLRADMINEFKLRAVILFDETKDRLAKPDYKNDITKNSRTLGYAASLVGLLVSNEFISSEVLRFHIFRLNQMFWMNHREDSWFIQYIERERALVENEEVRNYIEEIRAEAKSVSFDG